MMEKHLNYMLCNCFVPTNFPEVGINSDSLENNVNAHCEYHRLKLYISYSNDVEIIKIIK